MIQETAAGGDVKDSRQIKVGLGEGIRAQSMDRLIDQVHAVLS